MDDYLIDRETLSKFIDELIKKKPLPVDSTEELNTLRENSIKALDKKIGMAIFTSLSDEQLDEYNAMLDQNEESPEVFDSFFEKAGLDLEQIITKAAEDYAKEFLGGQNE